MSAPWWGRFGIRSRLLVLSSVLLALPVLGYYYARETQAFLLEGQESAQALAARAIATVLHGRDDLFDPRQGLPLPADGELDMPVHLLSRPVRLNGDATDWGPVASEAEEFGERHVFRSIEPYAPSDVGMRLVLGYRGGYLYAFVSVRDDRVLFRHPLYGRLDHSDHLRLLVRDADGALRRYVILARGAGTGTSYLVQDDWAQPVTGEPEPRVRSEWRTTETGYDVELRVPDALLGRDGRVAFLVADVDDPRRREVDTLLSTVPTPRADGLNRLLVRSPEIERILDGLDRPGARVWVVDTRQRVRAVRGEVAAEGDGYERVATSLRQGFFGRLFHSVRYESVLEDPDAARDRLVNEALAGRAAVRRVETPFGLGVLMAAHPIWSDGKLLGAVVLEQSESEVLTLQRRTMENLIGATLVLFCTVAIVLFAYSTRLTFRIRRLRNAAEAAIDDEGRVQRAGLTEGVSSGDEIGDLAREISAMLHRLSQYTQYLELMPRTLKHEMQNPLSALSTSLQHLATVRDGADRARYMAAAQRGVERLGTILESLTEAANLEDALQHEERREIDLGGLVVRYVENVAPAHPRVRLTCAPPAEPLPVMAADAVLEQMLDKLVDNAVEFTPDGGEVAVSVTRLNGEAHVRVRNDGPPLPAHLQDQLFESMVSGREPGRSDRPHLGLGLYVARLIAEHHGGHISAENLPDGDGVRVSVRLPIINVSCPKRTDSQAPGT